MKKLTILLSLMFTTLSLASPNAPCNTVTIEGTVEYISWFAVRNLKGRPGSSGSARHDRTIPAHYKIKLIDKTVIPESKNPSRSNCGSGELIIGHDNDDGYLQQGMRIKVIDYRTKGDEGGTTSSFTNIEFTR